MILHLNKTITETEAHKIAQENQAFCIHDGNQFVLITSSSLKEIPPALKSAVSESWVFPNDNQLASRTYKSETREIDFGSFKLGGNTKNTLLIGGPCSVESEEQIRESATFMAGLGNKMFRGGCYKPRTSPYSFPRFRFRKT